MILTGQSGNCYNVTDTLSNSIPLKLLPAINQDLKVCDLIKEQNIILKAENVIERRNTKQANEALKKEKRKRIFRGVVRTAIEITILYLLII